MAELVDALVSNTNGSNIVPVRSRLRAQRGGLSVVYREASFFCSSERFYTPEAVIFVKLSELFWFDIGSPERLHVK